MGGLERKAISKGFAFYSPLKYSELPRYYRENIRHLNVAMFQVAPMDKHGFFNFGPNASQTAIICDAFGPKLKNHMIGWIMVGQQVHQLP